MEAPRLLHRSEIDFALWDGCVERHDNGLIYFRSWYLDAMCPQWSAVVWGDYKAVMPLPWRKKWGLKYVYQPAFVQRLGVTGDVLLQQALQYAQQHFRFIHYNVGAVRSPANFVTKQCCNLILPLAKPYAIIQQGYSQECIKNIRKAQQRGCVLKQEHDVGAVITAYRNAYEDVNQHAKNEDYKRVHALFKIAANNGHLNLYTVVDERGSDLFHGALMQDSKRLYYVLGAPTAGGRQKRATYFFIDQMLRQHAGEKRLFDFEGSDLPNVAHFYQSFGPQTEGYSTVRISPFTRI